MNVIQIQKLIDSGEPVELVLFESDNIHTLNTPKSSKRVGTRLLTEWPVSHRGPDINISSVALCSGDKILRAVEVTPFVLVEGDYVLNIGFDFN